MSGEVSKVVGKHWRCGQQKEGGGSVARARDRHVVVVDAAARLLSREAAR